MVGVGSTSRWLVGRVVMVKESFIDWGLNGWIGFWIGIGKDKGVF